MNEIRSTETSFASLSFKSENPVAVTQNEFRGIILSLLHSYYNHDVCIEECCKCFAKNFAACFDFSDLSVLQKYILDQLWIFNTVIEEFSEFSKEYQKSLASGFKNGLKEIIQEKWVNKQARTVYGIFQGTLQSTSKDWVASFKKEVQLLHRWETEQIPTAFESMLTMRTSLAYAAHFQNVIQDQNEGYPAWSEMGPLTIVHFSKIEADQKAIRDLFVAGGLTVW